MILYELVCENDHSFEGWFRDSVGYDEQVAHGEVVCPLCGTPHVRKALMAPRLARHKGGEGAARSREDASPRTEGARTEGDGGAKAVSAGTPDMGTQVRAALHELRRQVEAHCDYVGDHFAEEARKIHYGDTDARPIYGETSKAEAEALKDEGVTFVSVPWLKTDS